MLVGCEVASKRMVQTLIEAGSPVNVVAMVSGGVSVRCHVRRVCVCEVIARRVLRHMLRLCVVAVCLVWGFRMVGPRYSLP